MTVRVTLHRGAHAVALSANQSTKTGFILCHLVLVLLTFAYYFVVVLVLLLLLLLLFCFLSLHIQVPL